MKNIENIVLPNFDCIVKYFPAGTGYSDNKYFFIKHYSLLILSEAGKKRYSERIKNFNDLVEKYDLNKSLPEIQFFLFYYWADFEINRWNQSNFNDNKTKNYVKEKFDLTELLMTSSVVRHDKLLTAPYVYRVSIETDNRKGVSKIITINNYTLCIEIAEAISSLLKIENVYIDDQAEKNNTRLKELKSKLETILPNNKKSKSFDKEYILGLKPLFNFIKNENLFSSNTIIYQFITEFISIIGFQYSSSTKNDFVDYIKKTLTK